MKAWFRGGSGLVSGWVSSSLFQVPSSESQVSSSEFGNKLASSHSTVVKFDLVYSYE